MTWQRERFGPRRANALRNAQLAPAHTPEPGVHRISTRTTPAKKTVAVCACGQYASKAYGDPQKALAAAAQHIKSVSIKKGQQL